ncbi:MAG: hypothetical protein ACRC8S_10865 [Fimbriiglobus sp.]
MDSTEGTKLKDDFFRLVVAARNPDRLFAVESNKGRAYYAGILPNGDQALIGRASTQSILIVLFSGDGYLQHIEQQQLPRFQMPPEEVHLDVNDEEFQAFLNREYGFRSGTIWVRKFSVQVEDSLWVDALPWSFNDAISEMMASIVGFADEEWAYERKLISDFIHREQHVIEWADNWRILDREGRDVG